MLHEERKRIKQKLSAAPVSAEEREKERDRMLEEGRKKRKRQQLLDDKI